jgi:putative SOS response-associated peptidase YedK
MKDGQPYALAGLWEKWKDRKAGTELLTFTVITTDPNAVVEPMHDRMPVIIPQCDEKRRLKVARSVVVALDEPRTALDVLWPEDTAVTPLPGGLIEVAMMELIASGSIDKLEVPVGRTNFAALLAK